MESDLIQRAKNGDDSAFDALIEQHREVIFRYAYLITRDAHAAEDVAQDAVLRIYRYLHQFRGECAFRPWALQITRNVARNNNRAWGRRKYRVMQFINQRDFSGAGISDVESLTQQQQQAQQLHEVVSQLNPDYRDVVYMRFFVGLSVEETAQALNVADGTVKSRMHRALKQLRTLIQAQYPHLNEEFP